MGASDLPAPEDGKQGLFKKVKVVYNSSIRTDGGRGPRYLGASVLATCHQATIPALDFFVEPQRAVGDPPLLGPPQPAPT